MNRPILNRDFQHPSDGWYQLEAKGEHPNKRAGVVQIIDDAACESIVNRFNAEADKAGFPGMLIDHDHFKHDEDKETVAYGWLMRLQNRADGVYGQIRWSGTGQKVVDDGDYRFFSTEYDLRDTQILNDKKPRRIRPMRLDGLTLTNVNNNKGQKPITNRNNMNDNELSDEELRQIILNGDYPGHAFHGNQYADGSSGRSAREVASKKAAQASGVALKSGSAEDHASASIAHHRAAAAANKAGNKELTLYHDEMANMHADAAAHAARTKNRQFPTGNSAGSERQQTESETMKTVIKELGLPDGASEADALKEVQKIKNRVTELQTVQIETDLETYKDRYPAAQKEFVKSLLITNRAGTIDYLKAQPVLKGNAATPTAPGRIHNRDTAQPSEGNAGGEEVDQEALSIEREEAIEDLRLKNRELTYEDARNRIRNRRPELFGLPAREMAGAV
jgi:hypothetical protein